MNYLIIGSSSAIAQHLQNSLISSSQKVWSLSRSVVNPDATHHLTWQSVKDELPNDFLPDELHGLVYFPGTINLKPFHRTSQEDFMNDLEINFLGAVKTLQWALPSLKKGNASVVLLSTVATSIGMSFHSSIASSKGALEGLAKSLAAEWAPSIRVNVVAPSLTNTPLASSFLSTEDKRQAAMKRHPLNKFGTPDDISNAVKFLLSPESSWMTGQTLHVDGGLSSVKIF